MHKGLKLSISLVAILLTTTSKSYAGQTGGRVLRVSAKSIPKKIYVVRGTVLELFGDFGREQTAIGEYTGIALKVGSTVRAVTPYKDPWQLSWDTAKHPGSHRFSLRKLKLNGTEIPLGTFEVDVLSQAPFRNLYPGTDAPVSGSLPLHVQRLGELVAERFEVVIDNKPVGTKLDSEGKGAIDLRGLSPGTHNLGVKAILVDGGEYELETVSFNLSARIRLAPIGGNGLIDVTAPGATSTIPLRIVLQPDVRPKSVQLFIDNRATTKIETGPFERLSLDVSPLTSGLHSLKIVMLEEDGRTTVSDEMIVQVKQVDVNKGAPATQAVTPSVMPKEAWTGAHRPASEFHTFLAEIADGHGLPGKGRERGKFLPGGDFNPDVLKSLLRSPDPIFKVLVPIALDLDALRHRPGPRPQREKREYDEVVERALPGLRLPFRGREIYALNAYLRNENKNKSDASFDAFIEGQANAELMVNLKGLLQIGLRRRLRDAAESWADARPTPKGEVLIGIEQTGPALSPVVTIKNTTNQTLRRCIVTSRTEVDVHMLALIAAGVRIVDEKAREVFSDKFVNTKEAATEMAHLGTLQEQGDLCLIKELAPGASIQLIASSLRLVQRVTVSFYSDELKAKKVIILRR